MPSTFEKVIRLTTDGGPLNTIAVAGGYVIAGTTGGSPMRMFLIKTDLNGDIVFFKRYGFGRARALDQTADGGFILAANI